MISGLTITRHVVGSACVEDEQALQDAHLRRGQTDAVRVVHQVRHPVREPHEIVVEPIDLTRAHAQDGVRVLANLRERDTAPRLRLSVELRSSSSSSSSSSGRTPPSAAMERV